MSCFHLALCVYTPCVGQALQLRDRPSLSLPKDPAISTGARRFVEMLRHRRAHRHVHVQKSVNAAVHRRNPFPGDADYRASEGDWCGGYHHDTKGSFSNHEDFRGWHKGGKSCSWLSSEAAKNWGHRLQLYVVLRPHHVDDFLRRRPQTSLNQALFCSLGTPLRSYISLSFTFICKRQLLS